MEAAMPKKSKLQTCNNIDIHAFIGKRVNSNFKYYLCINFSLVLNTENNIDMYNN